MGGVVVVVAAAFISISTSYSDNAQDIALNTIYKETIL